jgi:hypothetical protein
MGRRELRTGDPSEDRELFEFGSKLPYIARVRVTINGLDYGTTSGLFEYYDDDLPHGHYVSVDNHVQPCPPGTYCPEGRNTNFTLCDPGTFQPRQAQRSCIDCPIGARCPDHGMRWYQKCPAGFACATWGTKEATTLCPAGHYCREGVITTNPRIYDNDTRWHRDNETGVVVASPQMAAWILEQRASKAFKIRTGTPFSWNESGTQGYRPPSSFSDSPYSSQSVVYAPVPFPCPIGHYCKQGASSHIPIPSNFSTPQRCYDGYFCPAGSATPEGSGACPTGHFCPSPVMAARCPRGHHCPGVANVFPRECAPGTFNGLEGMSNCALAAFYEGAFDSSPGMMAGGGFLFEFGAVRTASGPSRRVGGTAVAAMASSRPRRRDGVSATSRHRDAIDATARESTDRVERPRCSAQARCVPRATSAPAGRARDRNYVRRATSATR